MVMAEPVHRVRLTDLLLVVLGAVRHQLVLGPRREVVAVIVVLVPRLVAAVDLRRVLPRVGRRLARGGRRFGRVGRVVLVPLVRLALVLLGELVRALVRQPGRRRRSHLRAATTGHLVATTGRKQGMERHGVTTGGGGSARGRDCGYWWYEPSE